MSQGLISITSLTRSNGTASSFTYEFDNTDNEIESIAFRKAIIPRTFYNVPDLAFTFTDTAGTYTVNIPEGEYSITDFLNNLIIEMNLVAADTFSYSIDPFSHVLTLSSTGIIGVTLLGDPAKQKIAYMLGFEPEIYLENAAGPNDLVASFVINFGGTRYLNIVSSSLTNYKNVSSSDRNLNNYLPSNANGTKSMGVIAVIPVDVEFGQNIIFERDETEPQLYLSSPKLLNSIDIHIYDDHWNLVDLHGHDVFVAIDLFY
jgi:hypothetical protein